MKALMDKIVENIQYIKLHGLDQTICHGDICDGDRFELAARMRRIQLSSQDDLSKEQALLQAACSLNQEYEQIVYVCDCVACNKMN